MENSRSIGYTLLVMSAKVYILSAFVMSVKFKQQNVEVTLVCVSFHLKDLTIVRVLCPPAECLPALRLSLYLLLPPSNPI